MKINYRGLCLLAGVALAVLKLAGVIAWPWLAVSLPLIAWGWPYILGAAAIAGYLALGVLAAMLGVVLVIAEKVSAAKERKQMRRNVMRRQASGDVLPWDASF